jgi:putative DNA primase/helicase
VTTTTEEIRAALACIPADDRDVWIEVGMALQSELPGDDGFALFDAWSQKSEKYNARAVLTTWRGFGPGPVSVLSLFKLARQLGYRPEVQASAQAPSPEAMKARAEERRATAARETAERDARQSAARDEARRLLDQASEQGESPYLVRKGVKAHGVRFAAGGALQVPMHDAAGELWNVQTIRPARPTDGGPDKLFIKGGRKTGTFHMIGDPAGAEWLLLAEGYATAASCFEATGRPAVVAFDAGNLPHVVRALRGRYPTMRIMVCGDDDAATMARTGKNPGREKATEAAKLARGEAAFPQGLADGASDWNDLHQSAGLDEVRAQIEAAIQAAKATQSSPPTQTQPGPEKTAPAGRQQAPRGKADETGDGPQTFDRFRNEDGALWFDSSPEDRDYHGRTVKVCGELHVTAMARDAHDNGAALLLEFDTPFRKGRRWLMPLAMLAGDGTAYRAELLSQGFMVPTDAKRRALLTAYLQSRKPADLVRIVDRVGWHGRCYVLPRETLGDDGGERILFQSETPTEGTFSQLGTADQWRHRIGRPCVGNSRLMFFASLALAGPLLRWASGADGGIIHLVGDSSSGKTTALRVGASIYGGPEYLKRWRATDNGIEGVAALHSDAALFLDESGQMDGRAIGEAAYMLANGQGKARASRTGGVRPCQTWRLLIGSSGEVGIVEMMSEANKRTRAGQELRMIDLPADAGAGMGAFEDRHEFDSPGALAQHLARATAATYGTVGRAWLEFLTGNIEDLARELRSRMDTIEARFVPELASGQVQRTGRKFALVAAAGEMASEAGLTGWLAGAATDAAGRCFNAWIEARPGGIGMSETAQMLRQLRTWFGLHGDARFVDWDRADDDHAPKTMNRAGWRKKIETTTGISVLIGWDYFVLPDVFRTEVCKGFSDRAALRLLHELGHLHRESPKGFGCRASPPGADKVSVYRIKSSILSEADE